MVKNEWHQSFKNEWHKNEVMELTYFLHAGTNSGKLKVISMILGWVLAKIGMTI